MIPTGDTDPAHVAAVSAFADRVLGKGVVVARDTPNFIGNHLALHGVVAMLRAVESGRYTIDEVDAITGRAIGRPASATFRTMDIAGLDVLGHVLRNLEDRLPSAEDRAWFRTPDLLARLLAAGALGEKAGPGLLRAPQGRRRRLGDLHLRSGQRRVPAAAQAVVPVDRGRPRPSTTPARGSARCSSASDRVGEFLRETLAPTLVYAARVAPDIAHSIDDVDRVMRWGFGWELGPFELIDAIGVREVLDAAAAHGRRRSRRCSPTPSPPAATGSARARCRRPGPGCELLRTAKASRGVVATNPGASLVDLGDGVLCVEFHSKMNAIGGDTIAMLQRGVREAARGYRALVVGSEATNFSAGANLMLVLLEAQEGNWDELDLMVRAFQQCMLALRYSDVPVVVAPAGLALGGGCEIALHADRVQAAGETYMGLVEVGVGLIPAGGGTKEMVGAGDGRPALGRRPTRCRTSSAPSRPWRWPRSRPAGRMPCASATSRTATASR